MLISTSLRIFGFGAFGGFSGGFVVSFLGFVGGFVVTVDVVSVAFFMIAGLTRLITPGHLIVGGIGARITGIESVRSRSGHAQTMAREPKNDPCRDYKILMYRG